MFRADLLIRSQIHFVARAKRYIQIFIKITTIQNICKQQLSQEYLTLQTNLNTTTEWERLTASFVFSSDRC